MAEAEEDLIECEICNKKLKCISATHLKTHGVDMKYYRETFPDAPLKNHRLTYTTPNRLCFWTERYGKEEGLRRYEKYKNFLAFKNTEEYLKKEKGWSDRDIKEYNSSRAVTLENCIKRHGKDKGTEVYTNYVKAQRRAGTSLDYFIEKYGNTEGNAIYKEVCRKKAHTIERYRELYGDENAERKLVDFFKNIQSTGFTSQLESDFCKKLFSSLVKMGVPESTIYFFDGDGCHSKNKQYGFWSKKLNRIIMCDFVVLGNINKCVEVFGNYWHCNPKMYSEDFVNPNTNKTSKETWEYDKIRETELKNARSISTMVVWESEITHDKEKMLKEVVEWILN